MDYLKLPKLNISAIVIAIALGVAAAVLVYFAQSRNLIPTPGTQSKLPGLEIKTVVQEENAVISVIEKARPSIVEIGSAGTGFIVNSRGLIVTDKHTVSDSGPYTIVTQDGQKYETKKIYKDPNSDLSLIQIDATGLKALELADSSKLKLGQTVIAIGQKEHLVNVSVGVVSGLSSLIQTDARINQDNSGGPLLNSAGQVIGVSTQAFGSAIPANSIKQFIDESIALGSLPKPYLGLRYKFVSNGALVQEVVKNGPVDIAGMSAGDVILKINGQAIDTENKVTDIVSRSSVGAQLELTVARNGKEISIKVVLQDLPNE